MREYVVWRVRDREVDWFILREGRFVRAESDEHAVYRSEVFPGLWLDPASLVAGNLAQVLVVLQAGLDSDAHQQFLSAK